MKKRICEKEIIKIPKINKYHTNYNMWYCEQIAFNQLFIVRNLEYDSYS